MNLSNILSQFIITAFFLKKSLLLERNEITDFWNDFKLRFNITFVNDSEKQLKLHRDLEDKG